MTGTHTIANGSTSYNYGENTTNLLDPAVFDARSSVDSLCWNRQISSSLFPWGCLFSGWKSSYWCWTWATPLRHMRAGSRWQVWWNLLPAPLHCFMSPGVTTHKCDARYTASCHQASLYKCDTRYTASCHQASPHKCDGVTLHHATRSLHTNVTALHCIMPPGVSTQMWRRFDCKHFNFTNVSLNALNMHVNFYPNENCDLSSV